MRKIEDVYMEITQTANDFVYVGYFLKYSALGF
jgi:hypothetical protein